MYIAKVFQKQLKLHQEFFSQSDFNKETNPNQNYIKKQLLTKLFF